MEQLKNLLHSSVLTLKSSGASNISTASMSTEEQLYIEKYQKMYGDIKGVCEKHPFSDIGKVAANVAAEITADVPSFVRLNKTFGQNAGMKWLYLHLKNILIRFLIDENKMADSQIDFLAEVIVDNFPAMKLTEFMLFESFFLSGRYKDFYGETSYIMSITHSLQEFKKDLNVIYAQIERDKQCTAVNDNTSSVSWEEFCRMKGMEGKPYPAYIENSQN